ncbi:cytochrome-c peroxidase [Pacificoceanicola onchidii]|uniref:cytochrome-c peroxidase n=1 Tax=Pacificoceanicola onchidii TaxID=2562685 RepID=UPI001F1104C2|nr:cytochrome c peroxidase [Pacificoceanicola onchidii]
MTLMTKPIVTSCLAAIFAAPALAMDLPEPLKLEDFIQFDQAQVELGQLLFYDKVLSGNQNIACATCHHHDLNSADGVSLGIGEGGAGLGMRRSAGAGADQIIERVPRNAPGLWNLGHKDVEVLFHDGRVSVSDDFGNGFRSPAWIFLPQGLNSLLAAQALFPMTSEIEMAGQPEENPIGGAAYDAPHYVWPLVEERVRAIDGYLPLFMDAFDHVETAEDITIVEIVNAIAAFEGTEFRNFDSPFDQYLNGEEDALSDAQKRGMALFYGEVGCATCHSGPLMSNQSFQALGLPPFGPGITTLNDPIARDVGRMTVSDDPEDAYRFRVPFLRNVALTAPYGHNGAMPTLEAMVRHHLDPEQSNAAWREEMASLPPVSWLEEEDFMLLANAAETGRIRAKIDIDLPVLSDAEVADIVAFLHGLTGETALQRPMGRPDTVPSGLPVD